MSKFTKKEHVKSLTGYVNVKVANDLVDEFNQVVDDLQKSNGLATQEAIDKAVEAATAQINKELGETKAALAQETKQLKALEAQIEAAGQTPVSGTNVPADTETVNDEKDFTIEDIKQMLKPRSI